MGNEKKERLWKKIERSAEREIEKETTWYVHRVRDSS